MISGYEKLDVWKLSHELALKIYRLSRQFPRDERFGLTQQIRRSALAVPTNIAEGNARGHLKEFTQFCNIAKGSVAEIRYLLRFAIDYGILEQRQYLDLSEGYDRVGRMLNRLITYLRKPETAKNHC